MSGRMKAMSEDLRTGFFAALFEGCEGLLELRALPSKARTFVAPDDDAAIERFAQQHAGENVFVGVASRRDASGGELINCRHLGALFVDIDFKRVPEPEARKRLAEFPLRPSIVVRSGGGLHVYWLLREPLELPDEAAQAKTLLRRLAGALAGGDLSAAEPARVLRLPGTMNRKPEYNPPRPVVLEQLEPERRYNPSDFEEILPPEPDPQPRPQFQLLGSVTEGARNATLYGLARSLHTKGFSALAIEAALLEENRARCRPPLPEAEVRDLAHHAAQQADRPDFAADGAQSPHLTDAGNARRFAQQHGAILRFCYAWASWLVFTGRRFERDQGDRVWALAKQTALGFYALAAAEPDDDARKALARWARYSESEPGIRRMLELAKSETGIPVTPDQLDRDPWTLNTPNGTLNLRTGELRPHRAEDLLTKLTAAPYLAGATHEVWTKFLEAAIPDPETCAFARRYAGYALTGSTREEVFVIVRGPTGGGKTTYAEALRRTWGDYAVSADFSTFLDQRLHHGPRDDVARLVKARLVTSMETRAGERLDHGLLKLLTGGDTVAARRLYERTIEFTPCFKLLLGSNHRPRADATDDALWRRLRELPFPTGRPNREDRDDSIKATLTDPAQAGAAILAWAVQGCLEWQARGLGEPKGVIDATADYKRSQDRFQDFLADRCVREAEAWMTTGDLRSAYEAWARDENERDVLNTRDFAERLRELGCIPKRTNRTRGWLGIRLRTALDPEPLAEAPEPELSEAVTPWTR